MSRQIRSDCTIKSLAKIIKYPKTYLEIQMTGKLEMIKLLMPSAKNLKKLRKRGDKSPCWGLLIKPLNPLDIQYYRELPPQSTRIFV